MGFLTAVPVFAFVGLELRALEFDLFTGGGEGERSGRGTTFSFFLEGGAGEDKARLVAFLDLCSDTSSSSS